MFDERESDLTQRFPFLPVRNKQLGNMEWPLAKIKLLQADPAFESNARNCLLSRFPDFTLPVACSTVHTAPRNQSESNNFSGV